jgi:hypothetical protein
MSAPEFARTGFITGKDTGLILLTIWSILPQARQKGPRGFAGIRSCRDKIKE